MRHATALLGITVLVSPAFANVTLIQDNRMIVADTSLIVDLNEPGGPFTDDDHAEFAPGFGTGMNNQVSSVLIGQSANQTIQTTSQATQDSSISSNTLHANLSVEADVIGSAHGFIPSASASSIFDVTFTLNRQMDFTFELLNISGINFDPGNPYHAKLQDHQGNLVAGFYQKGVESGTLEAGEYRMIVAASNYYEDDHQFVPIKSIEASLTFIPAPSSMITLGLVGIFAPRRRR